MAKRTQLLAPDVYDYVLRASSREPEVLARLRHATASVPGSEMQIGADQGQLLAWLVKLIGARRCIEVGTYTGYSALAVALALPADGFLVACDVSEEWTSIGVRHWREAGVAARIALEIRPALETLDELLQRGERGTFDFAFLDADKPNYAAYYERLLELLRGGGVIAVDNTLALAGEPIIEQQTASAKALRAFNDFVRADERRRPCDAHGRRGTHAAAQAWRVNSSESSRVRDHAVVANRRLRYWRRESFRKFDAFGRVLRPNSWIDTSQRPIVNHSDVTRGERA